MKNKIFFLLLFVVLASCGVIAQTPANKQPPIKTGGPALKIYTGPKPIAASGPTPKYGAIALPQERADLEILEVVRNAPGSIIIILGIAVFAFCFVWTKYDLFKARR